MRLVITTPAVLHIRKQRAHNSCVIRSAALSCRLINATVSHRLERIISINSKPETSGLHLTWSKTPETGFLATVLTSASSRQNVSLEIATSVLLMLWDRLFEIKDVVS